MKSTPPWTPSLIVNPAWPEHFPSSEFTDRGTYYLSRSPQGSEEWHRQRKESGRLTASRFASALGRGYDSPRRVAEELAGLRQPVFSLEARGRMDHGTATEPVARKWYAEKKGVTVREVGLAIPKWEVRLGGSIDGEVGEEGMIEIKCPERMYPSLTSHIENVGKGWRPPPFYHNHLSTSHYDQMQGCMAITGKKWCDYLVYATGSRQVYTERIWFDREYWEATYLSILDFLDNVLSPLLEKEEE